MVALVRAQAVLARQNIEVPAGRIESQQREFSVTARTDLNTVRQFGDVAVKTVNGFTVRLRDVARIEQAAFQLAQKRAHCSSLSRSGNGSTSTSCQAARTA